MHHDAEIASGRQARRGHRTVDEIKIRGAGILFEAEGELELPALNLDGVELSVVGIHVAPDLTRSDFCLDLKKQFVRDLPFDAHTAPREIECLRTLLDLRSLRIADMSLQSRERRDARAFSEKHRGVLVPGEPRELPCFRLGLVGIDWLLRLTRRGRYHRGRLGQLRRDRRAKRRNQDSCRQDAAGIADRHGERPTFDCHDGSALYTTSPAEIGMKPWGWRTHF